MVQYRLNFCFGNPTVLVGIGGDIVGRDVIPTAYGAGGARDVGLHRVNGVNWVDGVHRVYGVYGLPGSGSPSHIPSDVTIDVAEDHACLRPRHGGAGCEIAVVIAVQEADGIAGGHGNIVIHIGDIGDSLGRRRVFLITWQLDALIYQGVVHHLGHLLALNGRVGYIVPVIANGHVGDGEQTVLCGNLAGGGPPLRPSGLGINIVGVKGPIQHQCELGKGHRPLGVEPAVPDAADPPLLGGLCHPGVVPFV